MEVHHKDLMLPGINDVETVSFGSGIIEMPEKCIKSTINQLKISTSYSIALNSLKERAHNEERIVFKIYYMVLKNLTRFSNILTIIKGPKDTKHMVKFPLELEDAHNSIMEDLSAFNQTPDVKKRLSVKRK